MLQKSNSRSKSVRKQTKSKSIKRTTKPLSHYSTQTIKSHNRTLHTKSKLISSSHSFQLPHLTHSTYKSTLPFSTHHSFLNPQHISPTISQQQFQFKQFSSSRSFSTIISNQSNKMSTEPEFICIDAFCARQFKPGCESGSINYDQNEFITKVRDIINQRISNGENVLVDGYAPFCKHIFIENFTDAVPTSIAITDDNKSLIETSYIARTENELAVLSRYISRSKLTNIPQAKYLDLILYSREQIKIENDAMGQESPDTAQWGIVSIKAQDQPFETPMQPITMMRNALGKDQGGSGVPLCREKYKESTDFWSKNISIV